MTFLSSLLSWANAPFVVALGVAVAFVLLQLSGLLGLFAGGGDHEGGADHEADTGGHHEAGDADGGGDADAGHDGDAPGHAGHAHGGGAGKALLAGIGVGTMPLSIVWQAFAVCFALGGISANAAYFSIAGALPTAALAISAPVALVFASLMTRLVAGVFGRLAPAAGKTSTSRKDLVGKIGVVISSKVNVEFGEVRVTDATGIVHRIICRVPAGEEPIAEGSEVVLVEYDREKDLLFVAPLEIEPPGRKRPLRVSAQPVDDGPPAEAPPEEAALEEQRSRTLG